MSENTVNAALRRLGFSSDEMTAHGFRKRKQMMQHWADYLGAIAAGNKVVAGKFGQAA